MPIVLKNLFFRFAGILPKTVVLENVIDFHRIGEPEVLQRTIRQNGAPLTSFKIKLACEAWIIFSPLKKEFLNTKFHKETLVTGSEKMLKRKSGQLEL